MKRLKKKKKDGSVEGFASQYIYIYGFNYILNKQAE